MLAGFPTADLQPTGVNVSQYTDNGVPRFTVRQRFALRTTDIQRAQTAAKRQFDLVRQGVVLEDGSGINYSFTRLNSIKPDMIAAATKDARASAEQFAKDSGTSVGSIRSATQGYFSVMDRSLRYPDYDFVGLYNYQRLLGDRRFDTTIGDHFKATPAASSYPKIFLLGSSGYSAHLAAKLGLPFGFAHHFDMGGTFEAAEIYRSRFVPSHILSEPYMIVTANVLAADTNEEALWHAKSSRLTGYLRRTGRFLPLPSADDAARHPDIAEAERMPSSRIVGDGEHVAEHLQHLVQRVNADEVMVTAVAYETSARVRSLELLAKYW